MRLQHDAIFFFSYYTLLENHIFIFTELYKIKQDYSKVLGTKNFDSL